MPVSLRETVVLHEQIEADAYRDLIDAASADTREKLGLSYHHIEDGVVFVCRAVDHIMFDRVINLGVTRDIAMDALERAISIFQTSKIKNWVVQLAPGAGALKKHCDACGLTPHPRIWAIFSRNSEPGTKIETDISVREIGSAEKDAFAEIVVKSFGVPPLAGLWAASAIGRPKWKYFGGFAGKEMIACGSVYIDGRASWFGFGATLADHRGKKAQQALLSARIDASRSGGAEILFTETGVPHEGEAGPSFKNIQRAGFRIAYERPNLRLA